MTGSIGPLLGADESFVHQIVDTFATVAHTDPCWTEKVCGMAAARDGSLQLGFGFGKYPNRNVFDGYGGVSRGVAQWTVRASRALAPEPERLGAGPLHYEIVEPLRCVRVRLEPNAAQPVAFDVLLQGIVPCMLEEREDRRALTGYRHTAHQIRYHQTCTAEGWLELDGRRVEISPGAWVATRDHSWGVRPDVGLPLPDAQPDPLAGIDLRVFALWNPIFFERGDGSRYAFHQYLLFVRGPGFAYERVQGGFEHPDGRRELVRTIEPELWFDPRNKRLLSGRFSRTLVDGSERVLEAEALSDTGFHLGPGLYLGFDGKYHGGWQGALHVEGEHFPDCSDPATVARIHQFRDCMVRVRDAATGAIGWGNCQTYVSGAWPEWGVAE